MRFLIVSFVVSIFSFTSLSIVIVVAISNIWVIQVGLCWFSFPLRMGQNFPFLLMLIVFWTLWMLHWGDLEYDTFLWRMLILFHYVLSGNQLGMTQTANSDSQASTQTQFIPFSLSWVASSLHLTCVVLGSAKDLGLPPSGSSFLDFPSHFPEALVALGHQLLNQVLLIGET